MTADIPADSRVDTADTAAALRQLVALGYIEELPEDKQKAIEDTVSEQTYNLACSYMEAFRFAEAAPILEKLLAQNPDEHHIAMALADCRFALGHIRRARTLVDSLIRTGAQKRPQHPGETAAVASAASGDRTETTG